MDIEEPGMWLLSQDMIESLGYVGGSCLFMAICALVLYFKCRTKSARSATLFPVFDNWSGNVQLRSGEGRFEPFWQPSGYTHVGQPQPEEDSSRQMSPDDSSAACLQSSPPESEPSPPLQSTKRIHPSPKHQSRSRGPPSLLSTIVRKA